MIARLDNVNLAAPVNWQHPLNRGLVAWWLAIPQWIGGLNWYDLALRRPGTLNGYTANGWQASYRPGGLQALDFDGLDDYVEVADDAIWSSSTHTVLAWFRADTLPFAGARQWAVTKGDVANYEWALGVKAVGPSDVRVYGTKWQLDGSTGSEVTGTTTINTGVWYHLAETWDDATDTTIVYLNGIQEGTGTNPNAMGNGTAPVNVGRRADGGDDEHNGQLDDVRIYDRVLTAAEVFAVYHNSRLGYPTMLNRHDDTLSGEAAASAAYYRLLQQHAGGLAA